MVSLFVGVEVSEYFFSASGLDAEGEEFISGSYEMNSTCFSEFFESISSHCERLGQAIVAMDSTGCYHINLFSFLYGKGIHVVVINLLVITNFAKLSLRKTETNRKDASTIAKFLLTHQEGISQLSISQDLLNENDLHPLYHFIKSLGPRGEDAPASLPPIKN